MVSLRNPVPLLLMATLGLLPGVGAGWFWSKGKVTERLANESMKVQSKIALVRSSGGSLSTTLLLQSSAAPSESEKAAQFLSEKMSGLQSKISAPPDNKEDQDFNELNRDLDDLISKLKVSGSDRESLRQEARSSCQLDDSSRKWGHLLADWNDFLKKAVSPVSPEEAAVLKQQAEKLESAGNPPDSSSWKDQSIRSLNDWRIGKLKPVENP